VVHDGRGPVKGSSNGTTRLSFPTIVLVGQAQAIILLGAKGSRLTGGVQFLQRIFEIEWNRELDH